MATLYYRDEWDTPEDPDTTISDEAAKIWEQVCFKMKKYITEGYHFIPKITNLMMSLKEGGDNWYDLEDLEIDAWLYCENKLDSWDKDKFEENLIESLESDHDFE